MAADEVGENRYCWKDAAARRELKPHASSHLDVLGGRTIARVFSRRRGADQPPAKEKMYPRLKMREVRNRHQQLAAGFQHAIQLRDRTRLILIGEVLEHVETQRA